MSGFEVAGVVLGVIPLAISALEHYKAGKGTVATFMKFHGQLDTLIYRLKLQRTFFYLNVLELLRSAGVEEVVNKSDITEEECIKVLQNAKNADEMKEYLGSGQLFVTFHDILARYEACLKSISAKDDLKAILEHNPVGASSFAFRERLSFTMEKGSLKQLVEELSEDRLSLKELIYSMKTQQEYTSRHPSDEAQKLANKLSRIQKHAAPLFEALRKGCSCSCENKHRVFMKLDNRIPLKSGRRRKLKDETEFSLLFDHQGYLQETHVNVREDDGNDSGENVVKGRNTTRVVIVQHAEPMPKERIVTRLCRHVSQLQETGHVLKLKLSNSDLFLVEGEAERNRDFASPTTLSDILKAGCHDDDAKMFPKEQTLLALNVASSILQLQQTWWLCLPFNSNEIKILTPQERSVTSNSSPFIEQLMSEVLPSLNDAVKCSTIGPDPKTALTELAILLLEIWHHKPLDIWCAKMDKAIPTSPQARMMVAIEWLQATSRRLLPYQSQVIEQCLQVCAGALRFWHEKDFIRMYCENIIKPLQETLGAWDTSGRAYVWN
ncbi:hypothetical protein BBK36DRAFT_1119335 [Trichoderma citrinoviride]|uniref:DUF7580 domain-containing protein n=1 Tax=Trichoderma citrinoviride TaxID=58853 RepID=A0A2T4BAA2_9HYPO|nr:hypothetical protein BBK36DRAFT_1119335 [Trichoderma citrinoviride]PTB66161.1 hypothetical protein BBK36DRAFT_1119335 [Trichoderma citrinoviride]